MVGLLSAASTSIAPGIYLGWGEVTIQLGNFLVIIIIIMLVLFALAIVLPFPGGKSRK